MRGGRSFCYLSSSGIYFALGEIFWYAGHSASIFEGGGPQGMSKKLAHTNSAVEGVFVIFPQVECTWREEICFGMQVG